MRRQIEQRRPKQPANAVPTPTVASFRKPGSEDDAVILDDDDDSSSKKKLEDEDEGGGGPTNVRVERFGDDESSASSSGSSLLVRRLLDVAKKSPAFVWFYRQLRPLISLVLSMVYGRRGNSTDIRNTADTTATAASTEVDYTLILSYSILGCFLGIALGIVCKMYGIY